jgi:predicted transcriptional regulator
LTRPKRPSLTAAELRLMEIIWTKESATVAEVTAALPKQLDLAYNTVLTTMRILEEKGYLRHTKAKQGRAFVYHPIVTRESASRGAVRQLVRRFFANSPGALVLKLIESGELSDDEMRKIRELVEQEGDSDEERV